MATFLKVHHENEDLEIEEYFVNLEMITAVDEDDHNFDLADGESIHIVRDSEWEKIMSFVKSKGA